MERKKKKTIAHIITEKNRIPISTYQPRATPRSLGRITPSGFCVERIGYLADYIWRGDFPGDVDVVAVEPFLYRILSESFRLLKRDQLEVRGSRVR